MKYFFYAWQWKMKRFWNNLNLLETRCWWRDFWWPMTKIVNFNIYFLFTRSFTILKERIDCHLFNRIENIYRNFFKTYFACKYTNVNIFLKLFNFSQKERCCFWLMKLFKLKVQLKIFLLSHQMKSIAIKFIPFFVLLFRDNFAFPPTFWDLKIMYMLVQSDPLHYFKAPGNIATVEFFFLP